MRYYTPEENDAIVMMFFKEPFMVRMKYVWTINDNAYKDTSMPVYFTEEDANAAAEEIMQTTRTPYELSKLFKNGKNFSFVYSQDLERIYRMITDYCDLIVHKFDRSLYLRNSNIQDSQDIQQMWADVYDAATFANYIHPNMMERHQNYQEQAKGYIATMFGLQPVQVKPHSPYENKEIDPMTGRPVVYNPLKNLDFSLLEKIQRIGG